MSEWNLEDNKKMIYHHMMDEEMYLGEDIDILREKLIEKQRNHMLDEQEINRLFGHEVDTEYMRLFWEKRAQNHVLNESLTNLEEDSELLRLKMQCETPKMQQYIQPTKEMKMLDLGSGYGTWSFMFADNVDLIHAVDYTEEMIELGRRRAVKENKNNISFFVSSVQDYTSNVWYDLVLLSGVCLYLNDNDIRLMLKNMQDYTKKDTVLVLRDSTSIQDRYVINKEYSERLGTMYSATYRTREEYIKLFESIGFELEDDEDMFDEKSPLNKHKETRLRIYRFRRK